MPNIRRTILLADDSPTIQRLVTGTFAGTEFDVFSVSNGEAAIRKFDEMQPNVVLADIYMPGRNGYEVCAFVRQHPSLAHIPVVMLIGAFDAFDEDKARENGASASITKPFEPRALVALVQSVLEKAEARHTVPEREAVPAPEPESAPAAAAASAPGPAQKSEFAAPAATMAPVVAEAPAEAEVPDDLLGLETLFKEPEAEPKPGTMTEQDIDRIADRVIQRLSTQVIEDIAWEIVPDITEKIAREEFKKINEA